MQVEVVNTSHHVEEVVGLLVPVLTSKYFLHSICEDIVLGKALETKTLAHLDFLHLIEFREELAIGIDNVVKVGC